LFFPSDQPSATAGTIVKLQVEIDFATYKQRACSDLT
jgi:hypothetical protein